MKVQSSYISDDLVTSVFHYLPLKDKVRASRSCKQWHQISNNLLPPTYIMNILQSGQRLLGSSSNHAVVKAVCCLGAKVGYSLRIQPFVSQCKTTIYLHDIRSSQGIPFVIDSMIHDYFLRLTNKHFIVGSQIDGLSKVTRANLTTYFLEDGSNHTIDINSPDVTYIFNQKHNVLAWFLPYAFESRQIQLYDANSKTSFTIDFAVHESLNDVNCQSIYFSDNHLVASFLSNINSEEERKSHIATFSLSTKELVALSSYSNSIIKIAANEKMIAAFFKDNQLLILDKQTLAIQQQISLSNEISECLNSLKDIQIHANQIICQTAKKQALLIDLSKDGTIISLASSAFVCSENYLLTAHPERSIIEIWNLAQNNSNPIHALVTAGKVNKMCLDATSENSCLALAIKGQVQVWSPFLTKEPSLFNKMSSYVTTGFSLFHQ